VVAKRLTADNQFAAWAKTCENIKVSNKVAVSIGVYAVVLLSSITGIKTHG
jgi:hypothetical protein